MKETDTALPGSPSSGSKETCTQAMSKDSIKCTRGSGATVRRSVSGGLLTKAKEGNTRGLRGVNRPMFKDDEQRLQ